MWDNKKDKQALGWILKELKRLPLFKVFDRDYNGHCRSFYVRWMPDVDIRTSKLTGEYRIDFAQKKTMDRWANSTNFSIRFDFTAPCMTDIVRSHLWMEKICRSGLFNFNSYFSTLTCPWFGHDNKYYKEPLAKPKIICRRKPWRLSEPL